jgi:hypothetical protein
MSGMGRVRYVAMEYTCLIWLISMVIETGNESSQTTGLLLGR